MKHEWHAVVDQADEHPGGRVAELVAEAIWRVHEADLPWRGGERRWTDILDAVIVSRVPAHELCDAYLLQYCALGGLRPSVVQTN